ncbi:MAG TPA: hypothetical protein VH701_23955 [Vicinamibacterales bacterium]|jgi:hypothetical protein
MSNVVRPPFVVCVLMPEGERFAIIHPETMLARTFPRPKVGEPLFEAIRRYFAGSQLYTEEHLRARLTAMGLDEASVAEQIARARKQKEMNQHGSWDHITSIGYRNRDGQRVIRKTEREGSAVGQRVFILHCTVCDHEYGADGCDIYDRLCPKCQDGPPGLPV